LVSYLSKVPIIVSILFLVLTLFSFYAFGWLIEGISLLLITAFFAFIVSIVSERSRRAGRWLSFLTVLVVFVSSLGFEMYLLSALLLIPLIHSFEYYFRSHRKYPMESVFLSLLIGTGISASLALLGYLAFGLYLVDFIETLTVLKFVLCLIPLIALFILCYSLISIYVLRKAKVYSYNAFWRYQIFPFTIFNILTTRDSLKGSVVKTTLFITLFVGLILTPIAINRDMELYSTSLRVLQSTVEDTRIEIELQWWLDQDTNLVVSPIVNFGGESNTVLYWPDDAKGSDKIWYDCSINGYAEEYDVQMFFGVNDALTCHSKNYDDTQALEKQINLSDYHGFFVRTINGKKIVLMTDGYDIIARNVILLNVKTPSFVKELKSYSDTVEGQFKEEYMTLYDELHLNDYFSGKFLITLENAHINLNMLRNHYWWLRSFYREAYRQYSDVYTGVTMDIPISDGSKSYEERAKNLGESINKLSYLFSEDFNYLEELKYDYTTDETIIENTRYKLNSKTFDSKFWLQGEIKGHNQNLRIVQNYLDTWKDVEEEAAWMNILRYSVIEAILMTKGMELCDSQACLQNLAMNTLSPWWCHIAQDSKDDCILSISWKDPFVCKIVDDAAKREYCMNNRFSNELFWMGKHLTQCNEPWQIQGIALGEYFYPTWILNTQYFDAQGEPCESCECLSDQYVYILVKVDAVEEMLQHGFKVDGRRCEIIQDEHDKDTCYWSQATATWIPSLCENIVDEGREKRCYKDLNAI
ncbi:DUF308 domain-containing protein, partial [Nanoarchaeota archaeon]